MLKQCFNCGEDFEYEPNPEIDINIQATKEYLVICGEC